MLRRMPAAGAVDEEILKLDNQLCFAIYAASRAITSVYRPALECLGLSYPQYLVMLVLWERDGLSVSEIGERLMLDSGTLTPLLKRLEKQGLLIRCRDTQDERRVRISVTLAGAGTKSRAEAVAASLQCKLQLPRQKVEELRKEMKQLLKAATGAAEKA